MRQNDGDFTPYQDRPLRWEKHGRRPPSFDEESGATGPRQGSGFGCARGCGCVVVILLLGAVIGYNTLAKVPVYGRILLLDALVSGAVNGNITVNGQRVSVPHAWREPWRQTTSTYGEAFADGRVDADHVDGVLWQTTKTVLGGGGEIPAEEIRALCEDMWAALSPDEIDRLPPLAPDRHPVPTQAAAGDDRPLVTARELSLWATLSADERQHQYTARRRLLERLSTVRGPANAQRLVPESALIYDFEAEAPSLEPVMEQFAVDTPNPERMQAARDDRVGFSSPPSLAVRVVDTGEGAEALVHFGTRASTVQFWYWFDGPVLPDSSLEVWVDGSVVHTVGWPTSQLGAPDGPDWQHVSLSGLAAGGPSRVELHVAVSGARYPATLYIDDLVFTREGQD